jgi:NAD(P)-dependent dehydrogenase (short-subunit alcohol dehydrogenase family)
LGKQSVLALAKHTPEHIYFTGRNASKAEEVIKEVQTTTPNAKISFMECDLSSLANVEKAAKQFTAESQRLDILMCNAGILGAVDPGVTVDGYEKTFATNHLGHALLIKLLLPTLLRTAEEPNSDVRIISLTSIGFRLHPKGAIAFKDLRTSQADLGVTGHWIRYAQSKVANLLYASELARRYPNITSVSIHPGVVETEFVTNLSFWNKALVYVSQLGRLITPAAGAYNQLWGSVGPKDKMVNGAFYEPIGVLGKHTKDSKDPKIAQELWEWTQQQLEPYKV